MVTYVTSYVCNIIYIGYPGYLGNIAGRSFIQGARRNHCKLINYIQKSACMSNYYFVYISVGKCVLQVNGVDIHTIPASSANALGLALLDVMFEKEESAGSLVVPSKVKSCKKPALDPVRVKKMFGKECASECSLYSFSSHIYK